MRNKLKNSFKKYHYMKNSLIIFFLFISTLIFAQVPQGINYQSIIRTSAGAVMSNSAVTVDFKLYDGLSGPLLYHESHATNTNQFGMVNLVIGQGTQIGGSVASFSAIPWAIGIGYEVFVNSNIIGTKQLFMSVPYALHSRAPIVTYSNNILSIGGNTTTINTGTTYTAGSGIDINSGIITSTANIVGAGSTTVTGTYPNLIINTPTVAPSQSVSIIGINSATVTGSYPNFTVNVPNSGTTGALPGGLNGQFLYYNSTVWDTLPRNNLYFDGTNFGVGTTTPQAIFHVVGDGKFNASVTTPHVFTNTLTVTGGTLGQVLTSDAAGNGTFQNLPVPPTPTIIGTGIALVTPTTGINFTVNVPKPIFTPTTGILNFGGTNTVSITSPLSLSGTTLTSGVASNSVNLASLPGIWSTVSLTNAAITNTASLAGIGTLNPTYKLDVYGTGSVPATIHGYNSGATSSATGVFGENPNNGIGVYGQSNSGAGIWGKSTSGSGVYGESTSGDAGKFILPSNTTTASAVNAQTNGTGPALFARTYNVSPLALAAKFEGHSWMAGKLQLDSTLTVSGYNNPPNPAPLGEGRLYYDKINNKFKVSENGGAYVNLINSNVAPWQFLAGSIFPNNNPASDKVAIGSNLANALLDVQSTNSSGLTTQPVVSIINNNTSFNGLSLLNVVKNVGGGNDVALFENKTTTGGALTAKITNSVSSGNVIEAINDGMSSAAYLKNNLIGNTTTVLQVVHSGGGQGVNIQTNNASALHATSSGTVVPTAYINNSNGEAMQVYAQSRAIYAQNNANGMAAFETVNTGNGPTIMAYKNNGSTFGNVAQFNNNSTSNGADAVLINNSGSGAAIHAISGPTVTGGSNVALWLEEGHIKTSGANATSITTVTAISGVTVIGNDVSGKLSITTTTSSISANQEMIKVTFNKPYPSGVTPNVIITPSNLYSAGMQPYVSSVSNTGFSVFFNVATPSISRTYTLNYIVIQ